jgi:hypothetical protein
MAQGTVIIEFVGRAGLNYEVQASTDLKQWVPISTVTADPDGKVRVADADAARHPARFYRIVER